MARKGLIHVNEDLATKWGTAIRWTRYRGVLFLVTAALAIAMGGCLDTVASPAKILASSDDSRITITRVEVDTGHSVAVSGTSTLATGTCLRTQLFANGIPAQWWPTDARAAILGGLWQITLPLAEGEAPDILDPTAVYSLRVWQQDDASVEAVFWFDPAGPPRP